MQDSGARKVFNMPPVKLSVAPTRTDLVNEQVVRYVPLDSQQHEFNYQVSADHVHEVNMKPQFRIITDSVSNPIVNLKTDFKQATQLNLSPEVQQDGIVSLNPQVNVQAGYDYTPTMNIDPKFNFTPMVFTDPTLDFKGVVSSQPMKATAGPGVVTVNEAIVGTGKYQGPSVNIVNASPSGDASVSQRGVILGSQSG